MALGGATSKLRTSIGSRGVGGTLRHVAHREKLRALRMRDYAAEIRFDRTHRVSTRGVIRASVGLDGAHGYMPVRRNAFLRAVGSTGVSPSDLLFIDLGCGKGAALVLAADMGFPDIVGVEFDPSIAAVCAKNLRESPTVTCREAHAQVVCGDAAEYAFPQRPFVLFLYNPFAGALLQRVLDNLERSLEASPRDVWVVYLYPLERWRFDESSSLVIVASQTEVDAPKARPGDLYVLYRSACTG